MRIGTTERETEPCRAPSSADEDELDAELVEEGVLLRPPPDVRCRAAFDLIREAQAGVYYIGPEPRPSPEDEEQIVADMLEADKAEEAAKRRWD